MPTDPENHPSTCPECIDFREHCLSHVLPYHSDVTQKYCGICGSQDNLFAAIHWAICRECIGRGYGVHVKKAFPEYHIDHVIISGPQVMKDSEVQLLDHTPAR